MRKTKIVSIVLLLISLICQVQAENAYFDDGQSHVINNSTYQNGWISLDYNIDNNPGTHLTLSAEGQVKAINAYNHSTVTIDAGSSVFTLNTRGRSAAAVFGGTFTSYVNALEDSSIKITGGEFNYPITSYDNSIIYVKGGTVNDYFTARDGTIYLYGSNFMAGDIPLSYGDNLRDYGVLDTLYGIWLGGTITGTLQDNSPLNTDFYLMADTDAAIIIVPEPATIVLFGLGAMITKSLKIKTKNQN